MNKRKFITLLGGAAAWPLVARAQQREGARKIGVLLGITESDPDAQARAAAFREGLRELGWIEGRNLQIEFYWRQALGDDRARAADLMAFAPDVIVTNNPFVISLLQVRAIPIVFVQVPDPVAAGFVASLARPGGNVTGFTSYERTITSKWLGLLKEAAPDVIRIAVLVTSSWAFSFRGMEAVSAALGTQLNLAQVKNADEIERSIEAAGREQNSGLIVLPGPETAIHRDKIIALTAKHRLPTVYPYRYYAASGGIMSYGIDTVHLTRQAASYVDRILRGAKPADLPVQAPIKFELVINLKTAKALGLDVPATLIARADEVIE
jgi:putative tryptophan/tyrosine transport system substrate-binding protein